MIRLYDPLVVLSVDILAVLLVVTSNHGHDPRGTGQSILNIPWSFHYVVTIGTFYSAHYSAAIRPALSIPIIKSVYDVATIQDCIR